MWKRRSPNPKQAAAAPAPASASARAPADASPTSTGAAGRSIVGVQAQAQQPALPEGWQLHESSQYPGRFFYLHIATQTSQWERPTGPPAAAAAPASQEDLMAALQRAQDAGDETALRQILEKLNARAASLAAGQPEPQPEAEPTAEAARKEAESAAIAAATKASEAEAARAAAAREEAESAAIAAATKAAEAEAARASAARKEAEDAAIAAATKAAEAEAARLSSAAAKKRAKQEEKARKEEGKRMKRLVPKSPRKGPAKQQAEEERAAAAAAQAAALMAAPDQQTEESGSQQQPPTKEQSNRDTEDAAPRSDHDAAAAAADVEEARGSRPRYKAVAGGVIRMGVGLDSEKAGKLTVGEEFVALATQQVGETMRVQCDRGWVSVLAKSGKPILQLLTDDAGDTSTSDSDSESDPEDVVAAAADAEKWRVVRGSGFVYTEMPQEELARRRKWVLGVPLFSGLDERLADAVARVFEPRKVERKTVVIEKGTVGDQEMFFVAKGEVEVLTSLDTPPFATLGGGKFFGESSLLESAPRNAFVFARKAALLYVLRKSDLKPILRDSPESEAQMAKALQQHMAERAEHREAMEHLFEGGQLWKTLLDSDDDEEESDNSAGSNVTAPAKGHEGPTEHAAAPFAGAPKEAPTRAPTVVQQQNDEAQKPSKHVVPQAVAPQEKSQPPVKKSSSESPVKRSVALLKAASAEDKLIKAGDQSRVPEALRLYTEVLEVLEEALASDGVSAKVKETLGKKEKGVRRRIKLLAEAQHALEAARLAAAKAEKERLAVEEEVALSTAARKVEGSNVATQPEPQLAGGLSDFSSGPIKFAVLATCTVREGPEASSKKVGELKPGATIDVVQEQTNGDGLKVMQTITPPPGSNRGGWVKVKTSKGKQLLGQVAAVVDAPTVSPVAEQQTATVATDDAAQSPSQQLGLPPSKPAAKPKSTEGAESELKTDAAAFFANLQAGASKSSTTSKKLGASTVVTPRASEPDAEPAPAPEPVPEAEQEPAVEPELAPKPEPAPVHTPKPEPKPAAALDKEKEKEKEMEAEPQEALKLVMDSTPRTVDESTKLQAGASSDGGPLSIDTLITTAGLECETDNAQVGARTPRTPRSPGGAGTPRLRKRPPTLILQSEEPLPDATGVVLIRSDSAEPLASTTNARTGPSAAPVASTPASKQRAVDTRTAKQQQRGRLSRPMFFAGQTIEVWSESLGGWQVATVTAVTREMIRAEYAGRHRYIDLQLEADAAEPPLWRIPPRVAATAAASASGAADIASAASAAQTSQQPQRPTKLALATGTSIDSNGSPKASSLRSPGSPMSSVDYDSYALGGGRWGMSRQAGATSQRRDGGGDIHALEARVSSQLRLLLGGSASRDEAEEAALLNLGGALAVLDRAMAGSVLAVDGETH
jgi:CRP-like cAMP-binding protein